MAREKRKLYLAEMKWKKWSVHQENLEEKLFFFKERAFYRLNQLIISSRSEDLIFQFQPWHHNRW